MERFVRSNLTLVSLLAALALAACGGGDGGSSAPAAPVQAVDNAAGQPPAAAAPAPESKAPQATGNTATDGFNWFNYRRVQIGLQQFVRDARADRAAQGHSDYQKTNDIITHEQDSTKPGFTGKTVGDRLSAGGYAFTSNYAYGEVISATSDTSGFNAAEDLIAAIYHRFVIFDPVFRQAGAGSATVPNGATYFTANFVTERLDSGLGPGKLVVYPFADQQQVARSFFSDNEVPDPAPGRNQVGYPISVHADIISTVGVNSFSVRRRGADPMAVRLLTHAADSNTPPSAAAIIPLEVLAPATTYDVQFSGTVDGAPITRNWSFTTQ